jgi:hypothetical protein
MPVYTNPIIDQDISSKVVYYIDNKCALFTCNGSPEGVILANTGSIAISDNGSIYKKTTDDLTTGWVELTGGTVSSPFVVSGTNPTLSFVDTDAGDDDGVISVETDVMTIGIVGGTPLLLRNNGQLLSYPKYFPSNITPVGNAGGGLDPLQTFNLPANSLAANGDFLDGIYSGKFATAADKRLLLTFAGQTVTTAGSGLFDIDVADWFYSVRYTRLTATSVLCTGSFCWGNGSRSAAGVAAGNYVFSGINTTIPVADLNANASTILMSGEATANNDIVHNLSIHSLTQF